MTCWRCGAGIDGEHLRCPSCGAERPRINSRGKAANDAAQKYQQRMRDGAKAGSRDTQPRREGRRASQRPSQQAQRGRSQSRDGSMPPSGYAASYARAQAGGTRMVQRHEYEAIVPDTGGYSQVGWLRLCIIAILFVVILVMGIYFFLTKTMPGQRWLATQGRIASMEAYHEVGRMYMSEGSISSAVWALEIAQAMAPDKLDVLLDLGKAYVGSNDIASAELAFSLAIQKWPAHPDAYHWMIDHLREQGRNYEALKLVEMAIENESDDTFEAMLSQMLPPVPSVSKMSGTLFEKPFDVTLTIPEGATVYYTLDNTDPTLYGQVYTKDTAIRMEEGATMLRAVAYQGGLYSKEQLQTYNVAREIPDMPRASPTSGTYDSVRKVTLSADKGTTIYYTMDGTHPTEASMPYTEPITLRIGKTILRAVAVSVDGKYSSEMIVEYKCDGRTKTSMDDKDTISGLKLFSTTQSDFEAAYGPPLSSSPDGENILGVYTRCDYDFGYVVFLDRGGEKGPVLAELVTDSASFEGPRGIGIGSRMEDVIAAFRDEGGEANIQGNRVLYTLTVGKIGLLEKLGESDYKISYFHKLDNGQYIELTYHVAGGLVTRMEWLQYTPG